ncbi:AAA family ATPase, partial [Acinetobacter baumannii]
DTLEHGVIAVVAGKRGSYKSFIALDWSFRVARDVGPVYVISGEGGDYDRRAKAWIKQHGGGDESLPLYIVERRLDLNTTEGLKLI